MRGLPVGTTSEHLARQMEFQYEETAPYQWVRETWMNAREAGATRLHYGIDWMGVEAKGVYRRYIADNGRGMNDDEIVRFFSIYGESGKPVGTRWENRGVGAKLCLMPWNQDGLVVVSWQEDDGALIHILKDDDGRYILREFETEEGPTYVVEPYNDPDLGVDFTELGPDWVREEGGTIFLLLGSTGYPNTVLGDTNKDENKTKGIVQYLNTRLSSSEDMEISLEALIHDDETKWPKTAAEIKTSEPGRNLQRERSVEGMRYFVEKDAIAKGEYVMSDGSKIEWFLRKKAPSGGYGYTPPASFVAFEQDGEVYSVNSHRSALQAFGIYNKDVYSRTAILITAPPDDQVGPSFDRSTLVWADSGQDVTFHVWSDWFAQNVPDELRAPAEADLQGTMLDNGRLAKVLSEKYGERLHRTYLRVKEGARSTMTPVFRKATKKRGPIVNPGETHEQGKTKRESELKPNAGPAGGNGKGVKYDAAADIPVVLTDDSPYARGDSAVVWNPATFEARLYIQNPIVRTQVEYWQGLYPRGTEEIVEGALIRWYQEDLSLRIAHVESLSELYTDQERAKMLSEEALTASLLGLAKDDARLKPMIGGILQTKSLA